MSFINLARKFRRLATKVLPSFNASKFNNVAAKTPQERLEKLIKESIHQIEVEFVARNNSPHPDFHASSVVSKLIEKLSEEQARITSNDQYPILAQLVNNEIKVLKECSDSGCIAQAGSVYSSLVSEGTTFRKVYSNDATLPRLAA